MKKITVVLIVMIGFILFPSDSLAATIVNQSKKYTFSEMQKDIFALQERYPFLEVTSIGESTEGRDIYKITLGEGTQKTHMAVRKPQPMHENVSLPSIM